MSFLHILEKLLKPMHEWEYPARRRKQTKGYSVAFCACFSSMTGSLTWSQTREFIVSHGADLFHLQLGARRLFRCAVGQQGSGTPALPATNPAAHAWASKPSSPVHCQVPLLSRGLLIGSLHKGRATCCPLGKSMGEQGPMANWRDFLRLFTPSVKVHAQNSLAHIYV